MTFVSSRRNRGDESCAFAFVCVDDWVVRWVDGWLGWDGAGMFIRMRVCVWMWMCACPSACVCVSASTFAAHSLDGHRIPDPNPRPHHTCAHESMVATHPDSAVTYAVQGVPDHENAPSHSSKFNMFPPTNFDHTSTINGALRGGIRSVIRITGKKAVKDPDGIVRVRSEAGTGCLAFPPIPLPTEGGGVLSEPRSPSPPGLQTAQWTAVNPV